MARYGVRLQVIETFIFARFVNNCMYCQLLCPPVENKLIICYFLFIFNIDLTINKYTLKWRVQYHKKQFYRLWGKTIRYLRATQVGSSQQPYNKARRAAEFQT